MSRAKKRRSSSRTKSNLEYGQFEERRLLAAVASVDPSSLFTNAVVTATNGDDHGNNASTATAVGNIFDVGGEIESVSDQDWFRFDAIGGLEYNFETTLGSLRDTTLTLYDTNGATSLRFNDDGGPGLASLITWQAPASGSYYLVVKAFANRTTGT